VTSYQARRPSRNGPGGTTTGPTIFTRSQSRGCGFVRTYAIRICGSACLPIRWDNGPLDQDSWRDRSYRNNRRAIALSFWCYPSSCAYNLDVWSRCALQLYLLTRSFSSRIRVTLNPDWQSNCAESLKAQRAVSHSRTLSFTLDCQLSNRRRISCVPPPQLFLIRLPVRLDAVKLAFPDAFRFT